MKRIKSAPANIAEMVNRKKPINNLNTESNNDLQLTKAICFIPIIKKFEFMQDKSLILREKINPYKKIINFKKNGEKTFNNLILDYIDNQELSNINDEQSILLSILYYYLSEKVFTKNNFTEFILFIIEILLKYIITHSLNDILISYNLYNKDLITNNIYLLSNII